MMQSRFWTVVGVVLTTFESDHSTGADHSRIWWQRSAKHGCLRIGQ
jgi:hypothetical protein